MSHLQDQEQLSELYEDSLEEGYVICNKCDGTGRMTAEKWGIQRVCVKCWGEGKLDWIENAVGKETPLRSVSGSSSSMSSSHVTPTQKSVKAYVDMVDDYSKKLKKGMKYDNKNISRGGTVQRFHKMSHKS